jgi:Rhodopirellula transposase DDE domain
LFKTGDATCSRGMTLNTTTRPGLKVRAQLDEGSYPLGVKVSDRELAAVPLQRHGWHGEWNHTVLPTAA